MVRRVTENLKRGELRRNAEFQCKELGCSDSEKKLQIVARRGTLSIKGARGEEGRDTEKRNTSITIDE